MTYENSGEVEMTVLTPVTAVLAVIVGFLLLILFVGFITDKRKLKLFIHHGV